MKGMLVLLCLLSLVAVSCGYIGLGGDDETVEAKEGSGREVDDEYFDESESEYLFAEDSTDVVDEDGAQYYEDFYPPELGPEMPYVNESYLEAPIDALTPEELESLRAFLDSLRGEKGTRGDTGLRGEQGPLGPPGTEGSPGKIGLPGNEGPTGPRGLPGLQGQQGIQGKKGAGGDKGDKGLQGEKGVQGEMGPTGDKGPSGDQGVQGVSGEPGGPKGDTGPAGPVGPAGIIGLKGDKGDKGDKGGLRRFERVVTLDGTEAKLKILDAECTGGDRVVMGGGFQFEDDRVIVYESLPRLDGKGWRVKARGPDEFWQLRVYAICIFDEGD